MRSHWSPPPATDAAPTARTHETFPLLLTGVEILVAAIVSSPLLLGIPAGDIASRVTGLPPRLVLGLLFGVLYVLDLTGLFLETRRGRSSVAWVHVLPGVSAALRMSTLLLVLLTLSLELAAMGLWNASLFLSAPLLLRIDRLSTLSGHATDCLDRGLALLEGNLERLLARIGPARRPFPYLPGWKSAQSEL